MTNGPDTDTAGAGDPWQEVGKPAMPSRETLRNTIRDALANDPEAVTIYRRGPETRELTLADLNRVADRIACRINGEPF